MCRTLKDSLDTFIISLVVARILYFSDNGSEYDNRLQQTNAILLLSFCFIQLSDAVLHYSIKNDLSSLNQFVSRFIVPTILFSEIPIMYYATYKLTNKRIKWFEVLLAVLSPIALLSFIYNCSGKTTQGKDNFLIWCGTPITNKFFKFLFFAGILMATYHYPLNIYKVIFYFVVTLTFIYTFDTETFGSGWCHFANALAVLWLITFFVKKYI